MTILQMFPQIKKKNDKEAKTDKNKCIPGFFKSRNLHYLSLAFWMR